MEIPHRPGLLVTVLLAVLLALTAAAVVWLAQLGAVLMAGGVGLAGLVAAVAIGAASAQARDAERQLADLALPTPPLPTAAVAQPAPTAVAGSDPRPAARPGVRLRDAHPGEVPAAYLDAVLKGAQATQAGYRARERQL
jgi:hypothetical protein